MTTDDPSAPIGSRWRHLKRGTYYTVINHGTLQWSGAKAWAVQDDTPITIYESETDHAVYARPTPEFLDGRFERMALP